MGESQHYNKDRKTQILEKYEPILHHIMRVQESPLKFLEDGYVEIPFDKLKALAPNLVDDFLQKPDTFMEELRAALRFLLSSLAIKYPKINEGIRKVDTLSILPLNLPINPISIYELGPSLVDRVVMLVGYIENIMAPKEVPITEVYKCSECGHEIIVRGRLNNPPSETPKKCPECGSSNIQLAFTVYQPYSEATIRAWGGQFEGNEYYSKIRAIFPNPRILLKRVGIIPRDKFMYPPSGPLHIIGILRRKKKGVISEYYIEVLNIEIEKTESEKLLEKLNGRHRLAKVELVLDIVEKLQDTTKYGAPLEQIIEEAEKVGISGEEVIEILEKLLQQGHIYIPETGFYKVLS